MSKLIFIRSYLIIVLLILTVGWGLDRIMADYTLQENIATNKNRLLGSFLYIETILEKHQQNILAGWEQEITSIQKNLGYPVSLYQYSDFSESDQLRQFLE